MPFGSRRKKSTKADQKRLKSNFGHYGTKRWKLTKEDQRSLNNSFAAHNFYTGVTTPEVAIQPTIAGGAKGYIKELGGLKQARRPVASWGPQEDGGDLFQMYGPRGPRMAPRNVDPKTGFKRRKQALTIPKMNYTPRGSH